MYYTYEHHIYIYICTYTVHICIYIHNYIYIYTRVTIDYIIGKQLNMSPVFCIQHEASMKSSAKAAGIP